MANEVIASEEFGLEDKYGDIFANGYSSKELMFTRHIKTPPSMDDNVGSLFKMFGGATYKPTEMYFEILTQDDKRYEATFDSVMLGNGTAARGGRLQFPVRRAGRGVPGECTGNRDGKRGYILSRRKIYRKRSSEVERHEPELRA